MAGQAQGRAVFAGGRAHQLNEPDGVGARDRFRVERAFFPCDRAYKGRRDTLFLGGLFDQRGEGVWKGDAPKAVVAPVWCQAHEVVHPTAR